MNLKKVGKVFTSKFVGTGPSSYEKRIYRAAVSQRLRNTALDCCKDLETPEEVPGLPSARVRVVLPSTVTCCNVIQEAQYLLSVGRWLILLETRLVKLMCAYLNRPGRCRVTLLFGAEVIVQFKLSLCMP